MCFAYIKYNTLIKGGFYMSIAYHKKTSKNYIQYTCRIEENILNHIKDISKAEDISINECINQSLKFAIDEYNKNNGTKRK